jgi:hypothetical protein
MTHNLGNVIDYISLDRLLRVIHALTVNVPFLKGLVTIGQEKLMYISPLILTPESI